VVQVLIEAGADVNAKDDFGDTALIHATVQPATMVGIDNIGDFGKMSIVKLLIEAGADINVKDWNGRTALMHASNIEIENMLKAAGAIE
jgi:ankyrin repeat protein